MEMRSVPLLATLLFCLAGPALALDSEHLFGLTEGSDIGSKGERELELEAAARAGKRGGAYRVLSQATALKLTLNDSFRIAPIVAFDHHRVRGVPGLDDRNQLALSEFAFEMKYRALDRTNAPLGLTFGAMPSWGRVDEMSGERTDSYGIGVVALADKELIAERLFAAVNVVYAAAASRARATGAWEHDSTLAVSAAISGRLSERVFLGGEIRYERAHDGMGLDRFAGHGLFAGPAIYAYLSETVWASVVWNAQMSGRAAGDTGALDLTNFERHLVKFRLGIQF
jgi:hypothetical protein